MPIAHKELSHRTINIVQTRFAIIKLKFVCLLELPHSIPIALVAIPAFFAPPTSKMHAAKSNTEAPKNKTVKPQQNQTK